jgi:hypothetical protein
MPHLDWQFIVVTLSLAVAAAYVVRRGMQTFRSGRPGATKAGSCGSCGSCSSGEKAAGNSTAGFVPLENLVSKKPRL